MLAGGNLFAMAIAIVGALVQARFVSPDDLGYFNQFGIASGYVFFLGLGVWDSLHRRYPYYIGKGQRDRAIEIAEIAQGWYVAVAILSATVFAALSIWTLAQGNWRDSLGWGVQVVVIASTFYGGYLSATYRTGHDFIDLAKGSLLSSLVGLALLPFYLIWPYVTMAMRTGCSSLASLIYLHIHRPLKIHWRFNWRKWFDLVKEGVPMFIAGYGSTVGWSLLITTLVWKELGVVALGFSTMAFMILQVANHVPQAIVAVYTPRIIEEFGRTESVDAGLRICRKPLLWSMPGMLLLVVGGAIGLQLFVPVLMPKYVEAIPAMGLALLYLPFTMLEMPYVLLVATGDTLAQNIVTFVGLGIFAALGLAAIAAGLGLNGVIGASLLGRLARLLMIYGYINRARHQHVHIKVTPEPVEIS